MTKQDKREFESFCRGATDRQLDGIIEKESTARRWQYVAIAETEKARRGLS